ncbi:MAG: hypothetical protein Q9219_004593 [cf. Caloplaca sp. 3 TL-2023]
MHTNLHNFAATALAIAIPAANAFWRLECDGSVGTARIDPLMDFGGLSDHIHSIKGGSAFSATSTADDLLKSKCQSCGVGQDKSAYWTPPLYFMADDGTITIVPEKPPFKAYYELNTGMTSDGKPQKIEAFPNGFQMISGTNLRRNTTLSGPDPSDFTGPFSDEDNSQREQRAIGFNCMNYGHNGSPSKDEPTLYRHSLPEKSWIDSNCPDGIRLELQFPSCWNGEMDGGESHKSHVAFPNWINGGDCPAGFDRRLPALMYETIVATDQFIGKGGKFVLGNGDPTGYGYHGDFIAAWDEGVLQQAVEQCTDMGGQMKSCGVFEFPENTASCTLENLPSELQDENVEGPMQGLPGGCEVQSGPEPAEKGKGATGSSSGGKLAGKSSKSSKIVDTGSNAPAAAPVAPAAPAAPAPVDDKKDGGVIAEVKDKAPAPVHDYQAPSPVSPDAITTPPTTTPSPSVDQGGNFVSTEIYTDGRIVHENKIVVQEVTITSQAGAKAKRTPEAQAEHAKRAHRHHHHAMQHGIGGRRLR